MFLRVLFDKQWSAVMGRRSGPQADPAVSNFLTLPAPSATSSWA
jgi:branched-chain amino acid transport system permease protein